MQWITAKMDSFWTFEFLILNLFRISIFGFRILDMQEFINLFFRQPLVPPPGLHHAWMTGQVFFGFVQLPRGQGGD